MRSRALERLGRHSEAVEAAEAAVALEPAWPPAHEQLAAALSSTGGHDGARHAAKRARELAPDSPVVLNELGRVYDAQGN